MLTTTRDHIYIFAGLAACILVYIFALPVTIMDVDAAQYASMSREMADTGNYLQVTERHQAYLDKPPLIFWLGSLSFYLFGFNTVAFKLPSLLFALLAIFSTYKFGRLFYGKETGLLAGAFLASTQAFFLITNDTRTDTILTGAVIFSLWQLAAYLKEGKWHYWLFGFVGVAMAMLAKGPIGLMIPVIGLGMHLLFTGQWRKILKWQWLPGILLVVALLSPMLWGLYHQHGWEGIRFYFWTQSFGRITGESEWNNDGGFSFFFVHTFLWSFLPWSLLFLGAAITDAVSWFRHRFSFTYKEEYITWAGFLIPLLALSFSKYKLPHYIYPLFPLAAVIAARYSVLLWQRRPQSIKAWSITHFILSLLIWGLAIFVIIYIFPIPEYWIWMLILLIVFLIATIATFIFIRKSLYQMIMPVLFAITGFNTMMNLQFYPKLMEYQAPSEAAFYLNDRNISAEQVYCLGTNSFSFEFYMEMVCQNIAAEDIPRLSQEKQIYLFTDLQGIQQLEENNVEYEVSWTFPHYHVTNLKWKFLDPQTREQKLSQRYIIKVI